MEDGEKSYGQTNNSQKIYTHDAVFKMLRNRKLIFNYTLLSTVLLAKSDSDIMIVYKVIRDSGTKLAQNFREKWLLPAGKLGRSDSQKGRSYSAKLRHFLSI